MKNRILYLTAIMALSVTVASAQKATFTTNGGMTIGFGLGASYQGSDIANSMGGAFDFTLGSYLYKKENAFLAADWKFRFLAGENIAFDHRINPDNTYSNLKYTHFNYDLELGLTLNRLRERTRIVITGFAGAGLTHSITHTDLFDASGNAYDFSSIDPTKTSQEIRADLAALSDNDFETKLTGRAAVMPTAGFYIGYQFSKSFALGLEHKVNYSLSETNGGFGTNIDNKIVPGSPIDRNRYTSFVFIWSLGGGGSSRGPARTYTPGPSLSPIPDIPEGYIIDTLRAVGRSARRLADSVRAITGNLPVTINRQTNPTRIQVSNANVSAEQERTNRTNNVTTQAVGNKVNAAPPEVRFINPSAPVTVDKNLFALRAQTTNVAGWQDVTVSVNGRSTSNFSFLQGGAVTLNVGLAQGQNVVAISGKNASGSVTEKTTITYIPATTTTQNPVTQTVRPVVADTQKVVVKPPVINVNPVVPVTADTQKVEVKPPVVNVNPVVKPTVSTDKPCGIRINPGNASWQFCLVTPSGTYNRDNLEDKSFSYSGKASSLYFTPIAGGGDAIVNGKPYTLRSGQTYLFTGNLTVNVSTNNQGSMGQWSVCITADREPQTGTGNRKPVSPCQGK